MEKIGWQTKMTNPTPNDKKTLQKSAFYSEAYDYNTFKLLLLHLCTKVIFQIMIPETTNILHNYKYSENTDKNRALNWISLLQCE